MHTHRVTLTAEAPANTANPFFRANKTLLQEQVVEIQFATTSKGMKHTAALTHAFAFLTVNFTRGRAFLLASWNRGLGMLKHTRRKGVLHERCFQDTTVSINRTLSLTGLEEVIKAV